MLLAYGWSLVGDYAAHAQGREGENEIFDIVGTPPRGGCRANRGMEASTKEKGTPHTQSAIICVIFDRFPNGLICEKRHTRQGALVFKEMLVLPPKYKFYSMLIADELLTKLKIYLYLYNIYLELLKCNVYSFMQCLK